MRSLLRLKHQHDMLKATIQMREDMSAMMVHDLRNPVTSILLGTQFLLMKDQLKQDEKEKLKLVHASGQRLNSMINELLIMAKMEAGELSLHQTEVDLNALATTVLSNFQDIAKTKQLCMETDLPPPGEWIVADVNLLHRLLDNLLSNAVKFSPTGGKVTLQIYRSTSTHEQVSNSHDHECTVIQVVDEGPGIPKEMRQKIFNKYETGDRLTSTSQMGLGLTFCKMVVDAYDGQIYVEENSPQGSVFTVKI